MKRATILVIVTLLTLGISQAQVPGIVWERVYFNGYASFFHDVHETYDGGFIVGGFRLTVGSGGGDCVFRVDSDGNLLWAFGYNDWWWQCAYWIEELPDHGFIATGVGLENSGDDGYLYILRLDADGNEIWTKIYEIENSNERGLCVTPLPDGGFAVCGYKDPDVGMDQAWILRTDSNGDTLWTREWGYEWNDRAMRILYTDGALTVLAQCRRFVAPPGGSYLLRYDLNGNLLSEAYISELEDWWGQDMCLASDSGYVVLTYYPPMIAHVDSIGDIQWVMNPMGIGQKYGYSINPTMDGGYIYAGQNRPPLLEQDSYSGMIVKLDSQGNQQWWDFVYESDCDGLFSARQLSQGGYIAAGIAVSSLIGPGYLIRYEPEVGIESGSELPEAIQLNAAPNPFSSSLSISYSLTETGQVSMSVYDLSGRLVDDLSMGTALAGEHTAVWNPDPSLPSGCYMIVLDACGERAVRRCVKLN